MFEKEIEEYERVRANYQENIADRTLMIRAFSANRAWL